MCEASLNIRYLAGAPGRLAPGGTADTAYLALSKADKTTHLVELTSCAGDKPSLQRQTGKPDSFRVRYLGAQKNNTHDEAGS